MNCLILLSTPSPNPLRAPTEAYLAQLGLTSPEVEFAAIDSASLEATLTMLFSHEGAVLVLDSSCSTHGTG